MRPRSSAVKPSVGGTNHGRLFGLAGISGISAAVMRSPPRRRPDPLQENLATSTHRQRRSTNRYGRSGEVVLVGVGAAADEGDAFAGRRFVGSGPQGGVGGRGAV